MRVRWNRVYRGKAHRSRSMIVVEKRRPVVGTEHAEEWAPGGFCGIPVLPAKGLVTSVVDLGR